MNQMNQLSCKLKFGEVSHESLKCGLISFTRIIHQVLVLFSLMLLKQHITTTLAQLIGMNSFHSNPAKKWILNVRPFSVCICNLLNLLFKSRSGGFGWSDKAEIN